MPDDGAPMGRDAALAYVRDHSLGKTWDELATLTGVNRETLRTWCRNAKPPVRKQAEPRAANPARGYRPGTPAVDLPDDQRAALVETCSTIRRLVRLVVESHEEKAREAIEAGRSVILDRDTMGAVKSLTGAEKDLVTTYPGLMAEVDKSKSATSGEAAASRRNLASRYGLNTDEDDPGDAEE